MLTYQVYWENGFWWFALGEVNPRKVNGQLLEVLFRRRYRDMDEAKRCGEEALEHNKKQREEFHARSINEA